MDEPVPLGRLLSAATRAFVQEMHDELARRGHPDMRPAYGYALNAIRGDGATAAQLGKALGMTKQGAAKLVDALAELGYAERIENAEDARSRLVVLTARGEDLLTQSAAVQQLVERRWADVVGAGAVAGLRRTLEEIADLGGVHASPLRPIW